jgi:hypothetical protein
LDLPRDPCADPDGYRKWGPFWAISNDKANEGRWSNAAVAAVLSISHDRPNYSDAHWIDLADRIAAAIRREIVAPGAGNTIAFAPAAAKIKARRSERRENP